MPRSSADSGVDPDPQPGHPAARRSTVGICPCPGQPTGNVPTLNTGRSFVKRPLAAYWIGSEGARADAQCATSSAGAVSTCSTAGFPVVTACPLTCCTAGSPSTV